MRIAILTSGILPVPAVQGGAVENLIDFYLDYNDRHRFHDITVYSVWHPAVKEHSAVKSDVNHYVFIKVNSLWAKLRKKLYQMTHGEEYYHYTIEYYLHEAIKDIRHRCFDIIIIENRPAYALKLRNITKARLVYHLHNEKLDINVPQYQDIYNAAHRILTVSNYIKSRVQTINRKDSKVETVHNGIDLKAFSQGAKTNRASLGLAADDFVLVYSGRVNRDKGILELIDAMTLLHDYPSIKLMVIGSSFYGNAIGVDEFMSELKIKASTLKDRIIFTGFIPYQQIPSYLNMSDVAVIPSVWDDPFPTTVLEAQAMGLPIITTRRGGIPEEVTEQNAILLSTDEHFVDNLAAAIRDLYEHPKKRQQMSEVAIEHSKYYNKERYAADFFRAIETLS